MDLENFITLIKSKADEFRADWEVHHAEDPNGYPLALESASEWFEQFLFSLESEDKPS